MPGWLLGDFGWPYPSAATVSVAVSATEFPDCDISVGTRTWPGFRNEHRLDAQILRTQGPPQTYVYRVTYNDEFGVFVPKSVADGYHGASSGSASSDEVWHLMAVAVRELVVAAGPRPQPGAPKRRAPAREGADGRPVTGM